MREKDVDSPVTTSDLWVPPRDTSAAAWTGGPSAPARLAASPRCPAAVTHTQPATCVQHTHSSTFLRKQMPLITAEADNLPNRALTLNEVNEG